jgi:uncharacterized protein YndB with AHSA1/START domain
VLVDAPAERAFQLFVQRMGEWWDPRHHVLQVEIAEMVVEPQVGGAIFDRGVDGTVSQWGTVIQYDPPKRFAFTWHVTPQWTIDLDRSKASEVHVLFEPEGANRTIVRLDHIHLDRHGDGWEKLRDAVGAPESWAAGLQRLASLARPSSMP